MSTSNKVDERHWTDGPAGCLPPPVCGICGALEGEVHADECHRRRAERLRRIRAALGVHHGLEHALGVLASLAITTDAAWCERLRSEGLDLELLREDFVAVLLELLPKSDPPRELRSEIVQASEAIHRIANRTGGLDDETVATILGGIASLAYQAGRSSRGP